MRKQDDERSKKLLWGDEQEGFEFFKTLRVGGIDPLIDGLCSNSPLRELIAFGFEFKQF